MLVGDDTDLLVLLCYHACLEPHNIFLKPEPKKATMKPRVWNITAVKEKLGFEICNNILFLHTILGCDTTLGHSKQILCFPSTARMWLLPALNIPLFRILLLFTGYSCILIGSVKQRQLTCQQCNQVSTNFTIVLFCNLQRKK